MLLFSCAVLLSVISKMARLCEYLLCSVACRLLEEFRKVCKCS